MSEPTAGSDGIGEQRILARRLALIPGWVALVLTTAVTLVVDSIPLTVQLLPLIVSVLVLGLPHGAVDHLLVSRATGRPFSLEIGAAVGVVYLVVGGVYALAWFLAPSLAFAFFIVLTWVHWGQGDRYPLRRFVGVSDQRSMAVTAQTVIVRGGMPMLVPLLAHPEQYRLVATWLVGLFSSSGTALEAAFAPQARLALAVGFGTLVVSSLAVSYVHDDREAWLVDAGETLLLLAFFVLVPPLLAIGVYFCAWHSLRHVVRYLLLGGPPAEAIEAGRPLAAFARFGRDAAPLSALSLVVAAALYVTAPGASTALEDLLALYLVFIAVLTLPHVLFATWLDHYEYARQAE